MTTIPATLCYGCSALTSITMGNNITEIGGGAFSGCSNLASFTIPQGVTEIKSETFNECYSLSSVRIPENVTKIGYKAFNGVKSGATFTFDDYTKITEVEDYAFGVYNIVIDQDARDYILSLNSKAFDQSWVGGSANSIKYVWTEQ